MFGWLKSLFRRAPEPAPEPPPAPWEDPNRPAWVRELWRKSEPKSMKKVS